MVATVSNRARTTAAALGLDVDAILAQHAGQILSVKDVEAFAKQSGLHVAKAFEPPKPATARAQPPRPRTAITPKPNSATQPAPQPAASSASEDPLLLDGCRIEIMWPQSKVRHTGSNPRLANFEP